MLGQNELRQKTLKTLENTGFSAVFKGFRLVAGEGFEPYVKCLKTIAAQGVQNLLSILLSIELFGVKIGHSVLKLDIINFI